MKLLFLKERRENRGKLECRLRIERVKQLRSEVGEQIKELEAKVDEI